MRHRQVHLVGLVLIGTFAAVGFAGCSSDSSGSTASTPPSPAVTTTLPAVRLVEVAEAQALALDPTVVVIDVRTPAEFSQGHLARASVVDFSAPGFRDQIGALDRSKTYLVYCHSGNRSGQATAVMAQLGFTKVYDLHGGITAWQNAGAPVVV